MIKTTNIIPEFREEDLNFVVNNNPLGDLQYRNYFPLDFSTDLTFGSIETETGAKVMADIVSLDANVPLKGRELPEKIKGEIPKIEAGRSKNERDFFRLNTLRNVVATNPSNSGAKAKLLENIYDDAIFSVNAVNARLEYMAKSLLSQGLYKTPNGVTIDFKIKTQNASKDWFNPANAKTFDPIADFRTIQNEALKKGYRYEYAVMDLLTFNQLVTAESVVKFTASFAQNALGLALTPSLEQLNSALAQQRLPQIIVWESYVAEEGKNGAVTSTSGWNLGNIHFTIGREFGTTQYTTSPEAQLDLGDVTSKVTSDGFILVSVLGQANPIRVITKGVAFATPVLNNTNRKVILKTKLS